MITRYINFLLLIGVALFSLNAHSLQLGEIIFKSNQNSSLDVLIQVNLSSEDKIDLLNPSIASKENYDSQGIERTKIHDDISLSLSLTPEKSNKASLRLTSKMPVTESYLDLLIQIESPSGKILKEYTVLLDPPPNVSPRKKIQEKKEVPVKKDIAKIKKVEIKKIAKKKINKKAEKKVSKNKKIVIAKPGKTLFQIARENSFAGITTEQIVIAIYQTNPNSFDGNLNGLIKGKQLKLPLREYYKKLSHLDARKILRQENIAWEKISQPKKTKKLKKKKNKIVKKKKDLDELSRLKKELEIANKKLEEKEQVIKKIEKSNQKLIEPQDTEIKPTKTIPDPADSVNEIKDDVLSEVIGKQASEDDSNTFTSSITDQNQDIIQEIIIDDKEINKPIRPIFVLSLVFLLALLLGLLFIVRKKKQASNNYFSSLSDAFETKESQYTPTPRSEDGSDGFPATDGSAENPTSQTEINSIEPTEANELDPDENKDDNPR